MGGSNTTTNLTGSVQRWKGERESKLAAIAKIEAALELLPMLRERVTHLDALIASAEIIVREDRPDWSADDVQPRRKTDHSSPVPFGLLGRTALEVLRTAPPEGMRTRDITREIMKRFDLDPSDRLLLDKKTNSLNAYLKGNEGDLVQSDGERLYKRWRLIR
jgi:hypothetical protein